MIDVDALKELVGPHRVSTDHEDLIRHSRDMSSSALIAKREGTPEMGAACVVRPRETQQVAAVLRWAHETGTSVVPYGGGSGVCEGIKPRDAVVVDTRAMCEIRDFDEKSRLVRVEGGRLGPTCRKRSRRGGTCTGTSRSR
jgi:FAD/FMN-containing dehydrogenase